MPLAAMSGGLIFGLYRAVVTGEMSTVSKGYRVSSSVYQFAETPFMFLFFFGLYLALTGFVSFATVIVARRVMRRTTSN